MAASAAPACISDEALQHLTDSAEATVLEAIASIMAAQEAWGAPVPELQQAFALLRDSEGTCVSAAAAERLVNKALARCGDKLEKKLKWALPQGQG